MKHFFTIFVFVSMLTFSISFAQVNWIKYDGNPVLRPGSSGEWDDQRLGIGSVLFDGSTYHMWYFADSVGGFLHDIGYATSVDGITWTKYDDPSTLNPPFAESDPVLSPGTPGSWDDDRVNMPCVILIDTLYHMWYTGADTPDQNAGAIGHATSIDGINWEKNENNPVLDVGPPGSWDDEWVWDPWVLFDGSMYHMWYFAWNGIGEQHQIGHATSPHPDSTWTKDPNNPVLSFQNGKWDYPRAQAPCVIYDGNTFHMWYSGGQMLGYRIGYATSEDASHWTKFEDNPVLKPGSAGSWDETFVGFCSVIDSAGSLCKMWYTGGGTGSFGYATAPWSIKHVPGQYATIQDGIDAADSGDVVLVDEGTYYENINFKGKTITVASHYWFDGDTSHISRTIIDGSQPADPDSASVVYFISNEDTTSVLLGFTITAGSGTYNDTYDGIAGGGIYMLAGGKIIHNIITDNHIEDTGLTGGAGLVQIAQNDNCNVVIKDNDFTYNSFTSHSNFSSGGGGMYCLWEPSIEGTLLICNNTVSYNSGNNTATYKAVAGGIGLSIYYPKVVNAVVENNCITHNELHCTASMGAGIYVVYWEPGEQFTDSIPTPIIQNNIIAHNYSQDRGAGIGIWTVQDDHSSESTSDPQPAIINNTIVNNKANDGCGIFNFDSYPLLLNNILWDDLSVEGSREIFNDDIFYPEYTQPNEGRLFIYYSDIRGGWEPRAGNIDADPMFDDATFNLSELSPCVGKGKDSVKVHQVVYRSPALDYNGSKRPYPIDDFVDIGAIESKFPVGITEDALLKPVKFTLQQNYPNPFNPVTVISWQLAVGSHVDLSIYNILGQKVVTLVNNKQPAGSYEIEWDASGFASGVYYYQLKAGDNVLTRKMALIR